ncbi:MAG: nickel pincer cofactor biosynthesis protein LarC [Magnetococcus sp. DMHC-1]|nr:nickel pincer cofactor biosynthesis protein LarC [Magnetococcales bacterium]
MKIHLDLEAGISGNMFLGACLDLGLSRERLEEALAGLGIPDWSLEVTQTRRGGLRGTHVEVKVPHAHHHRRLHHILAIIHDSTLPDPVKKMAGDMFATLARAEAGVHGTSVDEIHFHEVGAVDAIIDICGAAVAVWQLGITHISSSPVPTGTGFVLCQHGRLPIPVPAVAELLRDHHVPLRPDTVEAELVTPTGAAILVTLADRFGAAALTRIDHMGYGAGSRELPGRPNVLRILAQEDEPAESLSPLQREQVVVLSSHVDDMNPEWYGSLWDRLLSAGALDVALIPMTMKKGRPGVRIEVVATPGTEVTLAQIVLSHTTALGVRLATMDRLILPRTHKTLATPWGIVRAKEAGGVWRLEHDDLEQLARRQAWSLLQAQQYLAPFLAAATARSGQHPA